MVAMNAALRYDESMPTGIVSGSDVYAIRHSDTGRLYIGCGQAKKRLQAHLGGSSCSPHLNRAVLKHGPEAFFCHDWDVGSSTKACVVEQWLINFYGGPNSRKLFNSKEGGGVGGKHSRETVEKVAAFHRGRKRSPETCRKIGAKSKGRYRSPEQIAKHAAAIRGRKRGPHTEESKEKMRLIALRRWAKKKEG